MRRKIALMMILLVPFSTLLASLSYRTSCASFERIATQSVSAYLTRVPLNVYSWRPALIFANVVGDFSTIRLDTTVEVSVDVERDPYNPFVDPQSWHNDWSALRSLHFAPAGVPSWYVTSIVGMPKRTLSISGPLAEWTIDISSSARYQLKVDGGQEDSGEYQVEHGAASDFPPVAVAMTYKIMENPALFDETFGLGPPGWVADHYDTFDLLVLAFDDHGLQTGGINCEYAVNNGSWTPLGSPAEDPLMLPVKNLFQDIGAIRSSLETWVENRPAFPGLLPNIGEGIPSFGVYHSEIPSVSAGSFVQFRANAKDVDDNSYTSPSGLYHAVDMTRPTRVLIVDPWVKLWVLQDNFKSLLTNSRIFENYELPASFRELLLSRSKLATVLKNHNLTPFHHWELLGKHYNLSIAWPGQNLGNLLKNQSEGGFEPHAIILSNLRLGLNITDDPGFWNWDLQDIKVDNQTVQRILINYTKRHHAGFLATRGTLSDWVVWLGPESNEHYKIGARGHVGNCLDELDILDEKTIASMLGMPQLALWEYLRDQVAEALTLNPSTEPIGLAVGSLPLQIPFFPLNSSLDATAIGINHPILEGVGLPFDLPTPSIYNEFGFSSYTQTGWQLAMARHIAFDAWNKSNKTLPIAEETINRLSGLIENATSGVVSSSSSNRVRDSFKWALESIYRNIISSSILEASLNVTFDFHELGLSEPRTIVRNIDFVKLLQLLPVKLIAASENYTAGIITHDKYWDENGYRSVYFSVEPEACEEATAETLLKNAVEWTIGWNFTDSTTLLGDIRVPNELAEALQNAVDSLPGAIAFSDSVVLMEEGQTIVEINVTTPGNVYLLVAHPTCEKINATLVGGNGEVQNMTTIAEGLTQLTLQANEAGIMKVTLAADPDSSLNPAYVAVIPEFPSLIILPLFMVIASLATIIYRRKQLPEYR